MFIDLTEIRLSIQRANSSNIYACSVIYKSLFRCLVLPFARTQDIEQAVVPDQIHPVRSLLVGELLAVRILD